MSRFDECHSACVCALLVCVREPVRSAICVCVSAVILMSI